MINEPLKPWPEVRQRGSAFLRGRPEACRGWSEHVDEETARVEAIEPTNSGSERALRPCAVYRKIANGFRQEWGAHLYADIRSVIETARRRAIRAIDAIRLTLKDQTLQLPAPAVA